MEDLKLYGKKDILLPYLIIKNIKYTFLNKGR